MTTINTTAPIGNLDAHNEAYEKAEFKKRLRTRLTYNNGGAFAALFSIYDTLPPKPTRKSVKAARNVVKTNAKP